MCRINGCGPRERGREHDAGSRRHGCGPQAQQTFRAGSDWSRPSSQHSHTTSPNCQLQCKRFCGSSPEPGSSGRAATGAGTRSQACLTCTPLGRIVVCAAWLAFIAGDSACRFKSRPRRSRRQSALGRDANYSARKNQRLLAAARPLPHKKARPPGLLDSCAQQEQPGPLATPRKAPGARALPPRLHSQQPPKVSGALSTGPAAEPSQQASPGCRRAAPQACSRHRARRGRRCRSLRRVAPVQRPRARLLAGDRPTFGVARHARPFGCGPRRGRLRARLLVAAYAWPHHGIPPWAWLGACASRRQRQRRRKARAEAVPSGQASPLLLGPVPSPPPGGHSAIVTQTLPAQPRAQPERDGVPCVFGREGTHSGPFA